MCAISAVGSDAENISIYIR